MLTPPMGGHRDFDEFQGDSYPAEFEVEEELFSGVCLADAPILFLLCFHRAFLRELAELCRIAAIAASSGSETTERGSEIDEIHCRFEFLKLAYDHHSAAEEEVISPTLDVHVNNVVCAYSLEFEKVSSCLKLLMEEQDESSSELFQELVSCLSIIHSSICHHMLKREKQVFPLLVEWFSPQEQASLVWQFLCSIPVMLLEDFLPWMVSLSPEKQIDVTLCITKIVPEESLQEVMISSLWRHDQFPSKDLTKEGGQGHMPRMIYSASYSKENWPASYSKENWQWKTSDPFFAKMECIPNECFHLWNGVLIKSLLEILEELHQIRSGSSLDVDPVAVRLKFLADVVTFYRSALKKFLDPMLNRLDGNYFTGLSAEQPPTETHLKRIQQMLHNNTQKVLPACEFVEELFQGMKLFVVEVEEQFKFLQEKVFPLLVHNCGKEMQLLLFLYMSFGMMPLGLLKFVITWFAACLSNHELGPILQGLNQVDSLAKNSFLSLVHEWLIIGYFGKVSVKDFFKDLHRISETRCSFLVERSNSCSSLLLNLKPCEASPHDKTEPGSLSENKVCSSSSLFVGFNKAKSYQTSYARGINLHVFFPQMSRLWKPVPRIAGEDNSSAFIMDEPVPLDFMIFFNKALKKDLENLVLYSAQLTENFGFLDQFCKRFKLLRHQYEFHSCAEDEWIFPLLEAKEKVKNITDSYAIDHKLQVDNFQKLFIILEEMSGLHMSVSSGTGKQTWRIIKWNHFCMELQRRCKSIHKLLSDHILREEIELWPVIKECLTIQDQEKVVANILGRIGAETLQAMILWLFNSLKPEEHLMVMSLWRKVTKHTNFSDWLEEWWKVCDKALISGELSSSCDTDSLETVSRYLSSVSSLYLQDDILSNRIINLSLENCNGANTVGDGISKDKAKIDAVDEEKHECLDCITVLNLGDDKTCNDVADITDEKANSAQPFQETTKFMNQDHLSSIAQDDLEAAITRICRDSSLDPEKKSRVIQNLLTSRWLIQKQIQHTDEFPTTNENISRSASIIPRPDKVDLRL
ncbi:Zinc finger protein BRUTUS-like At1g74770 [Linum grandiflorum]